MATPIQTQQDIDLQIAHLEQELLEFKRQRNELSPISTIPPEILCQILLLATSIADDAHYILEQPESFRIKGYIGTLCHVSHSWRTTALGCPELWTGIDIRMATDGRQVDFMLDHALPLPISLHIDAKIPEPTPRQHGRWYALDSVLRVLSKGIPFDKLALCGSLNFLTELLKKAQPATLQALQLVVSDKRNLEYTAAGTSMAQHPLFTRGAPELHTLTIDGCAIPLTSPILLHSPNLTSLSIHVQRDSRAAEVLDMLKAVRQIQQLSLDFRGYLTSSPAILDPVHLPYLSTVFLTGDSGSTLTTLSQLRLPATTIRLTFVCSVRNQSLMPAYGARLLKAVGHACWPHERVRNMMPPDEPFSPETLVLTSTHPFASSQDMSYLRVRNGMTHEGVKLEREAEVSITFFDLSTSCSVHWTEWHPWVLAKHPQGLQLTTGWSMDRLAAVRFLNGDADYCQLFWELLSKCPHILELAIAPTHLPKLIPHLSADNGGLPFPSLCHMTIQGARSGSATAFSTVGQMYESHLESLLGGLRERRYLCKKYGINKTWILDQLSLDKYVSTPSQLLLRTAYAEGLIGLCT